MNDLLVYLRRMYEEQKLSIPQIAAVHGLPLSRVRKHLLDAGTVMRSRADGLRLRADALGTGMRGRRRDFTEEHCLSIKRAAINRGEATAVGVSKKARGYVEYTRGKDKGRSVHVVAMEKRLGRRLQDDEVVHHIDGDRSNNEPNNLALVTRSGHTRLHRREQRIANSKEP